MTVAVNLGVDPLTVTASIAAQEGKGAEFITAFFNGVVVVGLFRLKDAETAIAPQREMAVVNRRPKR